MSLSLRARALARLLPLAIPAPDTPVEQQRARLDRAMGPGKGLFADEVRVGGVPGMRIRPRVGYPDRHLLHFHGGGFVVGTPSTSARMVGGLIRRTPMIATSVDYRLAPEHPYPAALDDAVAAYRGLLDEVPSERIVICGESAGGNLALSLLVRARDEGLALPAGAVVFSPWTDLTMTAPSVAANRDRDVLLDHDLLTRWRDAYVGDNDPAEPGMSPRFADLSGLPPLHVQATDAEMLHDDATGFADAARGAGVDVDLVVHPDLWHVFQLVDVIPEAAGALDTAAAFIARVS